MHKRTSLAQVLYKEAGLFDRAEAMQDLSDKTDRIWSQEIAPLAAAGGSAIAATPVVNWLERLARTQLDPDYNASIQQLRQQVQHMIRQPGANADAAMRHLRRESERLQELSRVSQSAKPYGLGRLPAKAGKAALVSLLAALAYKTTKNHMGDNQ
jgi:hypothetical protein